MVTFLYNPLKIDMAKFKERAPHEDLLLLLDQYCERLANDRKPAFLLFDEFPEVEKAENARSLIAGLRTSIENRANGLVAVFTASSQEGLRQVFSEQAAPFFRFAASSDFPPMTEDFVDHQLKTLSGVSKGSVERKKALEVFYRFDRNPLFFQRWLLTIASHPNMSEGDSIEVVQESLAEEFGFNREWLNLNSTQRIMARVLANPVDQIHGKKAGEFIMGLTGEKPPPKSTLREAIERLSKLGIVGKWDDEWRIRDPFFKWWIKSRPDSEF